jgi:hypothetical protein
MCTAYTKMCRRPLTLYHPLAYTTASYSQDNELYRRSTFNMNSIIQQRPLPTCLASFIVRIHGHGHTTSSLLSTPINLSTFMTNSLRIFITTLGRVISTIATCLKRSDESMNTVRAFDRVASGHAKHDADSTINCRQHTSAAASSAPPSGRVYTVTVWCAFCRGTREQR